jgi:hypothetical protein
MRVGLSLAPLPIPLPADDCEELSSKSDSCLIADVEGLQEVDAYY